MKHTLTQWRADIRRAQRIRQIVISVGDGHEATIAEVFGPMSADEADANTHLMAAAPQMYGALLHANIALQARPLTIPHDPEELRVRSAVNAAIFAANPDIMGWDESPYDGHDEPVEADSDFHTLTQRALDAHHDSLKAIAIGNRQLIEEAQNFAAGFMNVRLKVEVSPADFRITLPVEVECTIAHVTIEDLDFQLRFYPEKDYEPAYLQLCVDTVLYDVDNLADLGAILTRLKLVPDSSQGDADGPTA